MDVHGKNIGAAGDVKIGIQNNYFDGKPIILPNSIPSTVGFVGRVEYLDDLRGWYAGGKRCFLLHGMGGAGKTEIGKRFAEEIEAEYEAHVFLDLQGASGNPLSAAEVMWQIISRFDERKQRPQIPLSNPATGEPLSAAEQNALELRILQPDYLALLKTYKTLLLLDNAKDAAQIALLNQIDEGCLIVTARHRLDINNCEARNVEEMLPEDARALLERKLGAKRFDGQTDVIAELCGYLPLALRAAEGVLFKKPRLSAAIYAAKLKESRLQLHNTERDITVEAAFSLSYDYLESALQQFWRQLAIFPADFDTAAAAAVWNVEAIQAEETLADLESYGLLKWNAETNRLKLHDLVRLFTGAKLSADELFQTQFRHAQHYASVLVAAQNMQTERQKDYYIKALKLIDDEWSNITAGQKWTTEFFKKNDNIAELCMNYSSNAWDFTTLRLHPHRNIEWLEFGLKAARKLNNREGECINLGNLAVIHHRLGEYLTEIEYAEQSLEISRKIGKWQGESSSLGNLGNAYKELGEYTKAIVFHKRSLKISRKNDDRLGEGRSRGNLGNVYYRSRKYLKAIVYHKQALSIFRSPEVSDRQDESISLENLGDVCSKLGEHQEAIKYYKQSLEISCEIGDRRGEAIGLEKLGLAYGKLGAYQKAIEYFNQSLAVSHKRGDWQGKGNTLTNLGLAYYRSGEKEKGCGFWKEALDIFKAIESPYAEIAWRLIEENCRG